MPSSRVQLDAEPIRTPKLAAYLLVKDDAASLTHFIVDTLDGKISYEERNDVGRLVQGEVLVSDSVIMVTDSPPGRPCTPQCSTCTSRM